MMEEDVFSVYLNIVSANLDPNINNDKVFIKQGRTIPRKDYKFYGMIREISTCKNKTKSHVYKIIG